MEYSDSIDDTKQYIDSFVIGSILADDLELLCKHIGLFRIDNKFLHESIITCKTPEPTTYKGTNQTFDIFKIRIYPNCNIEVYYLVGINQKMRYDYKVITFNDPHQMLVFLYQERDACIKRKHVRR